MNEDQIKSIKDGEWWQSMLPDGWKLFGWTYRNFASAIGPKNQHVQLSADLLIDFDEKIKKIEEKNNNKILYSIIKNKNELIKYQEQLLDDFVVVAGILASDLEQANLKIKELEEKNNV